MNGKDIKKVMKNSEHIFDELAVIMKEGKRPNSILSNSNVYAFCLHFWEVFVLWDGAFSLARTVGPMEQDKNLPEICIGGSAWQRCTWLHRHPQGSHDAQARRISNEIYSGGLGDKMEDWVERLHQIPEPNHLSVGAGEGKFLFVAS